MPRMLVTLLLLATASLPALAQMPAGGPAQKSRSESAAPDREQTRVCNDNAREKGLKGEERRKFLQRCMKYVSNTTSAGNPAPREPAMQSPKP